MLLCCCSSSLLPPLLLLSPPRAGKAQEEREGEEEEKAEEEQEEEKEDGDEKGLSSPLSSLSSLLREDNGGVLFSLQTRQHLPGGLESEAARARGERGLTVAAPPPSLSSSPSS